MRQKEGVGPADIGVASVGGNQALEELGCRLPRTHQPVSDDLFSDPTQLSEGANNEALRGAHSKAAGDELIPDQPLRRAELPPSVDHYFPLNIVVLSPQSQQPLDPGRQWQLGRLVRRWKHQGNRLGQVSDLL